MSDDNIFKMPPREPMSIRQQAVLMAMQGWLATWREDQPAPHAESFAKFCVEIADAVLKAERDSR